MDRSQIPPLQSLTLRPRPLNLHCLSWSSDAELAVATDDCIHIFFPLYPPPRRAGEQSASGVPRPQFSLTLRVSSKVRPSVDINRQLFAFAGVRPPEKEGSAHRGNGPVHGQGVAMAQLVKVEWSPSGMGRNLRPILIGMLTTGSLIAFGEAVEAEEGQELGLRSRTVKMWKILWGLGGMLPVPDAEEKKRWRWMDESIVSFSWAKEIAPGRGLLAYRNDDGDVVIMSVQFYGKEEALQNNALREGWEIQEVARFKANGPHTDTDDPTDPDFVSSGSSFALKWSSWATQDITQTATLAYIAPNYVGFRRVSITNEWARGQSLAIEVEASDTISTCLFLTSDALLEWEDAIWTADDGNCSARGYIGTPSELKPFEVSLTGHLSAPVAQHTTAECGTTYPAEDGPSNPIAGIVVHPPPSPEKPLVPLHTVVRMSATGTNNDWYETNLPEGTSKLPSWVERIRKNTTALVTRANLMGGMEPGSESEDMDDSDEQEERKEKKEEMLHPYRFRIWGLATSPGGLFTAVVVSKYSSLYPRRHGVCNVYFGREPLAEDRDCSQLTTEGKVWEWMYADGPAVPAVTTASEVKIEEDEAHGTELRTLFAGVLGKQQCAFCDGKFTATADSALCENGHVWALCVSSGLAIMEPGISHVCAVCGMRCLRRTELEAFARQYLGPEVTVPKAGEACEACGGKFVV